MNPAYTSFVLPREVSVLSMAQIWRTGSNTYFLYFAEKSAKHVIFLISEGILDEISIALYFIMLAPEFERAFGKLSSFDLSCIIRINGYPA